MFSCTIYLFIDHIILCSSLVPVSQSFLLIKLFCVLPLVQLLSLSYHRSHYSVFCRLFSFSVILILDHIILCSFPCSVSQYFLSLIILFCVFPLLSFSIFLILDHITLCSSPCSVSKTFLSLITLFCVLLLLQFLSLFYQSSHFLCSSLVQLLSRSSHWSHYFVFFPLFSFSVFLFIHHFILCSAHCTVSQSFLSLITLFCVLSLVQFPSISYHWSHYFVFFPLFSFSVFLIIDHIIFCSSPRSFFSVILIIDHFILCSSPCSVSNTSLSLITLFCVLPLGQLISPSFHWSHYFLFLPCSCFSVPLILDHIVLCYSPCSVSQYFLSFIQLFCVFPLFSCSVVLIIDQIILCSSPCSVSRSFF